MSFDKEAQTWDQNQGRVERARVFSEEIRKNIPDGYRNKAMDFGCGTGLVSEHLADQFKAITLIDTSKGMLEVLRDKIKKNNWKHFTPVEIDLLHQKFDDKNYDVIYTGMTLHHIYNIPDILQIFYRLLRPGGYLCILDLVKEDGSFHSNPDFDGHKGFDAGELKSLLEQQNFKQVSYCIPSIIRKEVNGVEKEFPTFVSVSRKSPFSV